VAGAVVGLVLVGIAGGWALRTMLAPAADVLQGQGYTLVTAVYGTVGQSLRLNVTAEWTPELVVANQATGTVTTVELDTGAEVAPGDPVYTVDLRPVVVAAGEVPAFRDLGHGSQGDDVAQVQELLRTLGHPVGPADGRFGTAVHEAVRAWQRDLGVAADGVVRRGDVVFVPALPARLALAPEVVVGAAVAGGEPAVQVLPRAPSFTITLPDNQARLVSPGTAVEMPRDDGAAWRATVSEVRPAGEGAGPVAVLVGVEGAPVCRDACDQVPVQSDTLLPGLIQVVPEESGVTVPAAALVTTAAGQTGVVLDSGQLRPVEVVASASGVAVVEGVEVGEQVRTPGEIPAESGPDGR
jgi:peptidoglycan hydrolase-like protein with peptidoglycan-binding domain